LSGLCSVKAKVRLMIVSSKITRIDITAMVLLTEIRSRPMISAKNVVELI
jgi:hypothetical protein